MSSQLPDPATRVRVAVENQIGMLTCQVIELQIQLQMAHEEIGRLHIAVEQAKTAKFEEMTDEEVAREEAKFENEA